MCPPQQVRPETRSKASRPPAAIHGRSGQQITSRVDHPDHTSKVNRVQVHNFNNSLRPVGPYDGTTANARPQVADWAAPENALARASREDHTWPLPVKQLSEYVPSSLFHIGSEVHNGER